ncbi:hypothetical protein FRB99_002832 [Tulasnella sp. 403]|nr:hypothetical protein FRB99_002832 [Tulasnella sp. 403]
MLRRVSSAFLGFIGFDSGRGASNSNPGDASSGSSEHEEQASNVTAQQSETVGAVEGITRTDTVVDSQAGASSDEALHPNGENVAPSTEPPALPYTLAEGCVITEQGALRAAIDAGLVGEESSTLHSVLRKQPSVAGCVKSLQLVFQEPVVAVEADEEEAKKNRDWAYETQRKGVVEWARTLPALLDLEKVVVSHLVEGGEVYVHQEGGEGRQFGVSPLLKALAGNSDRLRALELEGVDATEEACKAFESSKVEGLKLVACPARVASIIPRLSALKEVEVIEKGAFSLGCDYLSLLGYVKTTLMSVTLNLQDTKLDVKDVISSLSGAPLAVIRCPFSTSTDSETDVEKTLKDAFPAYVLPGQSLPSLAQQTQDTATTPSNAATTAAATPSRSGTPVTKGMISTISPAMPSAAPEAPSDMEVEATPLSEVNEAHDVEMTDSDGGRALRKSRAAVVEKKKEERKVSDHAAREKAKIPGSVRKMRGSGTPQRQK